MGVSFDNTEIAFSSKSRLDLRRAYLLFSAMNNPFMVKAGIFIIKSTLNFVPGIKQIVRSTLFKQFCGGESIDECDKVIRELSTFKIGTVLDYSVEGEDSENDFEETKRQVLNSIIKAAGNADIPFAVFKVTGLGSSEILAKIQKRETLNDNEKQSYESTYRRVEELCRASYENKVRILIDAEETCIQNPIDEMVYDMMKRFNKEQAVVYNTFQMYRKDGLKNLKKATAEAEKAGYVLGAKLVRGAYMEKERERARLLKYESPIQNTKSDCDRDFDDALRFCIKNMDRISICSGTHNENSNYLLIQLMKDFGISQNDPKIYFVQLYGMSDHISYNLSNAGYNVGKYVPFGPIQSVMPYLFRRANENTAIAGQSSREFKLIQKELNRRKNA